MKGCLVLPKRHVWRWLWDTCGDYIHFRIFVLETLAVLVKVLRLSSENLFFLLLPKAKDKLLKPGFCTVPTASVTARYIEMSWLGTWHIFRRTLHSLGSPLQVTFWLHVCVCVSCLWSERKAIHFLQIVARICGLAHFRERHIAHYCWCVFSMVFPPSANEFVQCQTSEHHVSRIFVVLSWHEHKELQCINGIVCYVLWGW